MKKPSNRTILKRIKNYKKDDITTCPTCGCRNHKFINHYALEDKFREPFDIDLAKKIVSGEVEGEIRTEDNSKVRILDWNMSGRYSICAVVDEKTSGETIIRYTDDGKCNIKEHLDLVLYMKRDVQEEHPITQEWLLANGFERREALHTKTIVMPDFFGGKKTEEEWTTYFSTPDHRVTASFSDPEWNVRVEDNRFMTIGNLCCTTTHQLVEFCRLCGYELNSK